MSENVKMRLFHFLTEAPKTKYKTEVSITSIIQCKV